jgi:hypothetical protein
MAKRKTVRKKSTRSSARKKNPTKRKLSPEGRAAISKAAKKRWRAYRQAQKAGR